MRCDLVPTLESYIASWTGREFSYGAADCVQFAGGWVLKSTGNDVLASLPAWSSEDEGKEVLAAGGFTSLADAVSAILSPLPGGASFARRGDIVMHGKYGALGICVGSNCAFMLKRGLASLPLSSCSLAWAID